MQGLIHGVKLKDICGVLKDNIHLTEIFRTKWTLDDSPVHRVFRVVVNPGTVETRQVHKRTTDRFSVSTGIQFFGCNQPSASEANSSMTDTISKGSEFAAAEKAIREIGSDPWFDGLTPEWRDFLVSNTVETFKKYEVTLDQAAQKLIEFYVEISFTYPEAKTMNPWESNIPTTASVSPEDR